MDSHSRSDSEHKSIDTLSGSATGSVYQAAAYLLVSVVSLFGALAAAYLEYTIASIFAIWLSGTVFTLGILEYRRSQEPHGMWHGPEI